MIISGGRRYIFVHIPKTGGTALAHALEARALRDDILLGDTPKARARRHRIKTLRAAGRLWKHSTLADIDGILSVADLDRFRVCTIVRNPWDRVASYYHWLRAQRWEHPHVTAARTLDFPGFVADPGVARGLAAMPYTAYVTDASGKERCDLFLRQERLDADAEALGALIGLRLGPLQRVNASAREGDYRAAYDDATAERVGRIAAADIARFGYAF